MRHLIPAATIGWLLFGGVPAPALPASIKIGWSGPLSGNCAVVGVDSVPAVRMAFEDANRRGGIDGRRLELVVEDDGYDTVRALSAYKKLVHQDGVRVIMASTYGGVFASARDAVSDGALVIDTLDCNDDIAALPENTLCIATRSESIAHAFAADILRRGFRDATLLVEESDGWMQLIARATRAELQAGAVAVREEAALPAAADYKENLLRNRKASAMVFLGNDQMGLALRQARQLGITAQFYGVGSSLSPGFQALSAEAIVGALASSWQAPRSARVRSFLGRFMRENGHAPHLELAAVPAYDLANLLIGCLPQALEADGTVEAAKVRRCLLAVRNYAGLSGAITWDPDGAVRSIRERLYRVRKGKLAEAAGSD